ncbi:EamA family transporter [Streptomyces sp. 8L]|uniref:EamA family transporter n=1 Tax=Streptomyces sp. 8L TaxID=2877242 RepID=UPI001CD1AFBA|nr:EamA family transporter [Streptomyces sp. 8L]MCA1224107.1 EamA family transporter [Streptomyces sp. 8L]
MSSGSSSATPVAAGAAAAVPQGAGGPGGGAPGRSYGALGLVLSGCVSVQFGGAVAVSLMPRAGVLGIVALRLVLAAAVLLVACRPALRGHSRADWTTVLVFGAVLAAMNSFFYEAVHRIPLGAGVTLEVLGPLSLSVIASRRLVNLLWAACALGGVFLLSGLAGGGIGRLDPVGVAFGLAAAVMWATYILFSARTGRRFPQADGLALAMGVGALLALPFGIVDSGPRMLAPSTVGLALGVAVLSSVLPYTFELLALRRLPAATFAILMSLEPAIAATAGFLILGQAVTAVDAVAIALVIGASIGAIRTQFKTLGN